MIYVGSNLLKQRPSYAIALIEKSGKKMFIGYLRMISLGCQVLRSLGTWRYNLGVYGFPVELRAMFKYISYRRPELEGL